MKDPVFGPELCGIFEKEYPLEEDVFRALELIQSTDAVERCMAKAKEISESARSTLDPLPDSVYKDALLDIAENVVNRQR